LKTETWVDQIDPQKLAFNLVAVKLVTANIRQESDIGLAVLLIAGIGFSGRGPVKAKIVFQEMFTEQVLFHVEDLGKIVALDLHIGFANFLPLRRNVRTLLEQENFLV